MKKLLVSLALFACVAVSSTAGATVQNHTTAGFAQTITLNAGTTVLRLNVSSATSIIGMTGGSDGRVIYLWNVSASEHVTLHQEHTSATAADRLAIDANGGFRYLFSNGTGLAIATYDGTSQRWRMATLESYNVSGSSVVNGEMNVAGNLTTTGVFTGTNTNATLTGTGSTRVSLKPVSTTNNGSTLAWLNNAGSALFSMGPDYNGNLGKDFWLYDGWNGVTNLYANNTGTSYLSFGTSYGGLEYAESGDELRLFASGLVRMRLTSGGLKISTLPYYQRKTTGTAKPTMGSNCNGTGTATQHADSSDYRGSVTLGANASACTLTFAIPWDLTGNNVGEPMCTANTSTSGRSVAVTAMTDHEVTFTPSASGATTIYYHCDGIYPPQ